MLIYHHAILICNAEYVANGSVRCDYGKYVSIPCHNHKKFIFLQSTNRRLRFISNIPCLTCKLQDISGLDFFNCQNLLFLILMLDLIQVSSGVQFIKLFLVYYNIVSIFFRYYCNEFASIHSNFTI